MQDLNFSNEYYSDMSLGNMFYGILIHSPFSSGIIRTIVYDNLPENYYFLGATDIPNSNRIHILGEEVSLFAEHEIKYTGECVGLLIGPDKDLLKELKNSIEILLEDNINNENLSNENELKDKVEVIEETFSIQNDKINDEKNTETSIKNSEDLKESDISKDSIEESITVSDSYEISFTHKYTSELSGALCQFSANKYLVYTPSKWNKDIIAAITEATNIDKNNIIIANTASRVQKTTNELLYDVILATIAAVACSIFQKTIKIVLSRKEQDEYINNYIKSRIFHTSEVDKDGYIKSMSINIEIENGAYTPFTKKILRHMMKNAAGLYNNIKNINIKGKAYITNEAPKAFNTHSVAADVYFALESHIYNIAEKLNISTAEFKLKNIIDSDIQKIINTVTQQSDFYRKDSCYKLSSIKRKEGKIKPCLPFSIPIRGIGLSVVSGDRFNYKEDLEDCNDKTSMAAAVVELEADPCTYRQTLQRITLVVKAGKIENPINATTSLQRDVNQILDMLVEDTKLSLCPVNVSFIEEENAPSYIGDIIYNIIPSAYFQALRQILNSTINKMPINVEETFNMITSTNILEKDTNEVIMPEEDSKSKDVKNTEDLQENADNSINDDIANENAIKEAVDKSKEELLGLQNECSN